MSDCSFDTEIIFLINKFGMKVKEMPVRLVHKDASKVRFFKTGMESFISLMEIKGNDLRGAYEG